MEDNPSLRIPRNLIYSFSLLFFIGLLLGLFSVWSRYFIFTDGSVYATLGKNIAEGIGLNYCGATHLFYPPGYPLMISVFYLVLQDAELAAHLVSFFAYLLSILLMALLAWRMRKSSLFVISAAGLMVFHPSLILYSSYVMSESLFVCILLASAYCCWLLIEKEKTSLWLWILWGGLGGYASLIRADGIVYWPLQALIIFCCRKESRIRVFLKCMLSLLVMVAVMLPYLILIRMETGQWQLSTKTSILLHYAREKTGQHPSVSETSFTSKLSKDGKTFTIDRADETIGSFILHHPMEAMDRIIFNLKTLVKRKGITFGWIDIPLVLFLCFSIGKNIINRKTFFVLVHLVPILLILLFYIDKRFLLPFVPFVGLGIARAIEEAYGKSADLWNTGKKTLVISILVLGIAAAGIVAAPRAWTLLNKSISGIQTLPYEHKRMGEWMDEHLEITPTTRITHRNPWVSFYAGGCHIRTPHVKDLHRLLEWCNNQKVKYLVIDERMMKSDYPELAFLLQEHESHPGLFHQKTIEGNLPKIVLYRIE